MSRLPLISPRPLLRRDGIEIALTGVEFDQPLVIRMVPRPTVVVRLAALPSEPRDSQQRQYKVEFEQWEQRIVAARSAGGREEIEAVEAELPEEPGTRLLQPLQLTLEDDAGTIYTWHGSSTGGSGTEWQGKWFFLADDPKPFGRLTVRVTSPEGEAAAITLNLASP